MKGDKTVESHEVRCETLHDKSLSMAGFLMIMLTAVLVLFTVKTVIATRSFDLVRPFLDSGAVIIACALLTGAFAYFCDWAIYAVIRSAVIKKGTSVDGTIVSLKKISRLTSGGGKNDFRYIVETAEGERVKSGVYTTPVLLDPPKRCTVHRLGKFVVLTDIENK